jgi:ATP-dependent RNA helicase HelY
LTERGERLVGIYHESDLAIAEAIEEGVFADIDAASVAGLASAFVFTARNSNNEIEPWFPSSDALRRAEQLEDIVADVIRDEVRLGVPMTKPIDTSFFGLAHAWSLGTGLDVLLEEEEITGGDFVRTIKQLIDLLEQIADCGASFSGSAREAATSLRRGVVAVSQSSQIDEDFGESAAGDDE